MLFQKESERTVLFMNFQIGNRVCTLYGNLNVISFDDSMVETLMSANEEELRSLDNRIVFAFYPFDVDQTSASDDFDKRIKVYLELCADNS